MPQKNDETITIRKSTFIIIIVAIIAVAIMLGGLYYYKTKISREKDAANLAGTKEIGSIEPVEVSITVITAKECAGCFDLAKAADELKQSPILIIKQMNKILASSDEAKGLIKKYEITKIPTMIITGNEIDKLPVQGFKRTDNALVMEEVPPPFIDLEEKQVKGLTKLTYLTDKACLQCYEVKQHKEVIEYAFGIYIATEETKDISSTEGKELLAKYSITKVPTILLSEEANEYPMVQTLWGKLGTKEEDGILVFRNFEMTKDLIYKDLETNQLVNTSQMPAQADSSEE
jgi:thiol-disulfide isomerase/thioredoxin